jgi:hypothetical protein
MCDWFSSCFLLLQLLVFFIVGVHLQQTAQPARFSRLWTDYYNVLLCCNLGAICIGWEGWQMRSETWQASSICPYQHGRCKTSCTTCHCLPSAPPSAILIMIHFLAGHVWPTVSGLRLSFLYPMPLSLSVGRSIVLWWECHQCSWLHTFGHLSLTA